MIIIVMYYDHTPLAARGRRRRQLVCLYFCPCWQLSITVGVIALHIAFGKGGPGPEPGKSSLGQENSGDWGPVRTLCSAMEVPDPSPARHP